MPEPTLEQLNHEALRKAIRGEINTVKACPGGCFLCRQKLQLEFKIQGGRVVGEPSIWQARDEAPPQGLLPCLRRWLKGISFANFKGTAMVRYPLHLYCAGCEDYL